MNDMLARAIAVVTLVSASTAWAQTAGTHVVITNEIPPGVHQHRAPGPTMVAVAGDEGRADFASQGLRLITFTAFGEAQARDRFTVSGGVGSGIMSVNWTLDGTLSIPTLPPCSLGEFDCRLSLTYRELFNGSVVVSRRLSSVSTAHFALSGTVDVPFVYDQPFTGGFRLSGGTSETRGIVDALNTGTITSLVLPLGATLIAESGTTYPTAGPNVLVQSLAAKVQSLGLAHGTTHSLIAKLAAVHHRLENAAGDRQPACGAIAAFSHHVEAQDGKALAEPVAAELLVAAARIRMFVGC